MREVFPLAGDAGLTFSMSLQSGINGPPESSDLTMTRMSSGAGREGPHDAVFAVVES